MSGCVSGRPGAFGSSGDASIVFSLKHTLRKVKGRWYEELRKWYPKLPTNFPGHQVGDFVVPADRSVAAVGGVLVDRVIAALLLEQTPVRDRMTDQVLALHGRPAISSCSRSICGVPSVSATTA